MPTKAPVPTGADEACEPHEQEFDGSTMVVVEGPKVVVVGVELKLDVGTLKLVVDGLHALHEVQAFVGQLVTGGRNVVVVGVGQVGAGQQVVGGEKTVCTGSENDVCGCGQVLHAGAATGM